MGTSTTKRTASGDVRTNTRVGALVLRTAGTNCEAETARALELGGARAETLHLNALIRDPQRLDSARMLVIPGGFSYGDDIAAGRMFGARLRHALDEQLTAFVERGGYVLGICNGFQVLVELGLLEGLHVSPAERRIALTANESNRYECRWVHLRNEHSKVAWLERDLVWPCPVAHAEGRIALADGALEQLEASGQIALRYVNADGSRPEYPELPNGSLDSIAGLCDASGRVLGLMPHPERNLTPWNHPQWTRLPKREAGEGLAFFEQLVQAASR